MTLVEHMIIQKHIVIVCPSPFKSAQSSTSTLKIKWLVSLPEVSIEKYEMCLFAFTSDQWMGHIKKNAILYFVLIGVFSLQWLMFN